MSAGKWRAENVGGVAAHVYEGPHYIARFERRVDARTCVEAVNAQASDPFDVLEIASTANTRADNLSLENERLRKVMQQAADLLVNSDAFTKAEEAHLLLLDSQHLPVRP